MADAVAPAHAHRPRQAGAKADKKAAHLAKKSAARDVENGKAPASSKRNPRAFGVAKVGRVQGIMQRNLDRGHRGEHAPRATHGVAGPALPPVVVAVMGPPGSGKSSLIMALVKHFTRATLGAGGVLGPVTVVAGKSRRVTFVEVPNDLGSMLDMAKIADLALLTVDASYGFEMETFEFLNMLQTHGFPRVMGVLTHLDALRDGKALSNRKKELKARFWQEIHAGAKLFYLSGRLHGGYLRREIHNLALYITRLKFRPLVWRTAHPHVLVDRWEDVTPPGLPSDAPRTLALFGFQRGAALKTGAPLTIPGLGDFSLQKLAILPDPVPLPEVDPELRKARRSLKERETLLYAPMSDIGRVRYDADAVYIDVAHPHFTTKKDLEDGTDGMDESGRYEDGEDEDDDDDDEGLNENTGGATDCSDDSDGNDSRRDAAEGQLRAKGTKRTSDGVRLVRRLQRGTTTVDERMAAARLPLFAGSKPVSGAAAGYGDDEDDEGSEGVGDAGECHDLDQDGSDKGDEEGSSEEGSSSSKSKSNPSSHRRQPSSGRRALPIENVETDASGRIRRRAVFPDSFPDSFASSAGVEGGGEDEEDDQDQDEDQDEEMDEEMEDGEGQGGGGKMDEELDDFEKENGRDEDDVEEGNPASSSSRWKQGLVESAEASFAARRSALPDLSAIVYGGVAGGGGVTGGGTFGGASDDDGEAEEGSDDELLRPVGGRKGGAAKRADDALDADDCSQLRPWIGRVGGGGTLSLVPPPAKWLAPDAREASYTTALKYARFVTGAAAAAPGDSGDVDGDAGGGGGMGDFEDLETEGGGGGGQTASAVLAMMDAKALKKAAFDAEYDGSGGGKGGEGGGKQRGKRGGSGADESDDARAAEAAAAAEGLFEESAEVKAARARFEAQAAVNAAEFADVPPTQRLAMVGAPAGTYVRLEISDVPASFVLNFSAKSPLLAGGLVSGEGALTLLRARLKRHRWAPRILKSNDPLIFSIGWGRYQSLPLFSTQDQNERHRFLKYTPEHLHCGATWYGPAAPPNSGVMAFKSLTSAGRSFRVAATGVLTEAAATFAVVKKLKLTGVPHKIFAHTAFVRGMFNSPLEVAKFEGAAVKTVSGIRGAIKKAVRDGPPGTFRATFEDKVLMSDIVFCRTWVPLEAKRFCAPVRELLDARAAVTTVVAAGGGGGDRNYAGSSGSSASRALALPESVTAVASAPGPLMRTFKELRRAEGLGVPSKKDSVYTKVERPPTRIFNPVHIPNRLAAALPFLSKPKQQSGKKGADYFNKRAVVMDAPEREKWALMNRVHALAKEKTRVAKVRKGKEQVVYKAKMAERLEKSDARLKAERKRKYQKEGGKPGADGGGKKRKVSGGGGGGGAEDMRD